MNLAQTARSMLFGIPNAATRFETRRFEGGTSITRARIEKIGATFVSGYHAALEHTQPELLSERLEQTDLADRGFAYEGAAMALTLFDSLTPWKADRFKNFLDGPGNKHIYMLHVGAGWAWARLHKRSERACAELDPLLGWLGIDGYGFHEGYFHWPKTVIKQKIPRRVTGYGRRVFDQGLGRSLWFVKGATPNLIADTISGFPKDRQSDLWSGIGLAAAYAGGVDRHALETIRERARDYAPGLAQGTAFAAKARQRAGNPTGHTQLACNVFCGLPADDAAQATDDALVGLQGNGNDPAYEVWRQRIQMLFKSGAKR